MGRGDKKTEKGKRFKGSFGNARPSRTEKPEIAAAPKKEKAVAKKAPAKKAAAKKKEA